MKKALCVLSLVALLFGCIGCNGEDDATRQTEQTEQTELSGQEPLGGHFELSPNDSFTLDDVLAVFVVLVNEMHASDGLTNEQVYEILDMELIVDPEFTAVTHAYTGIEGVGIMVGLQRGSADIFVNASLSILTDDLVAPLPVSRIDLTNYGLTQGEGLQLEYFEELLERPGILFSYITDVFTYKWFAPDFTVSIEVDENNNVQYFRVENASI